LASGEELLVIPSGVEESLSAPSNALIEETPPLRSGRFLDKLGMT
jgi:hypothetical protein